MKKNRSILSKLIISYVVIVAIPLLGFIAMYSWMQRNVEQYALRLNEEIIQKAHENINEILEKVDSSQLIFSANSKMSQVASYTKKNAQEDFECYLLQKELAGVINSNENIYHIYIYFPASDICVLESTTLYADDFFERYYGMDEAESAEWKEKLLQTKYKDQEIQNVAEGAVTTECVDFLQKYPIGEKKVSAVCVVSVKKSKLFAPLQRGDGNSGFFIVNRGSNVLFQENNGEWNIEEVVSTIKQGTADRKNVIISAEVLKSGWQLYSVTDRDKVLEKVNEMRTVSILLLVVYAVICWYIIQTMTRRNYEPLQNLLRSISNSRNIAYERHTNEYDWLQEAWAGTREEIKRQRAVVLEKFLLSLLKGKVSEKEWKEKKEKLGLKCIGEDYVVLCFKITEPEKISLGASDDFNEQGRLELSYFVINNIATELLEKRYTVLSVTTDDSVICILNFADATDGNALEDITNTVSEVKNIVKQYFNFSFLTVISEECSFYYGIHEAYKQVLEGLEHQLFYPKDAVISYSKIEKSLKTDYYYPLEMEQNLIQCITNGDFEESRRMVNELFRQNFEQIMGNKVLAKCFMSDFMATMVKAVSKVVPNLVIGEDSEISQLISKLLEAGNIHEMQEDIVALLEYICTHINSKSGSDVSDRVVAIIEKNYTDTQLSVTSIAEMMNLHPVYLGSLFREQTGEKLLDYIARYRIDQSKALMKKQTYEALEDVGRAVGYDNVRTFTRVFKKYEGISPASYKKTI